MRLKNGEMLKMLKLENPNLEHFPGKDVEDVNVFWGILGFIEGTHRKTLTSLTFPLFQAHFSKKVLKTREMLKLLKLKNSKL